MKFLKYRKGGYYADFLRQAERVEESRRSDTKGFVGNTSHDKQQRVRLGTRQSRAVAGHAGDAVEVF